MLLGLFIIWLFPLTLQARVTEVGAGEDWCAVINGAAPGDHVLLAPGNYGQPCYISVSGTPEKSVIIQSQDGADPAHLDYEGAGDNVINFVDGAAYVVLRDLKFGPTQPDIDAIKIKSANHLLIERCEFRDIGGISISANSKDSQGITVRDNAFINLEATGLYFGCHDGEQCQAKDVVIERNLISGVDSSAVGYGLEIKLNSWAIIRDNTIYNTKGPGVMVYGSNQGAPESLIDGNYVEGSREDGGIVIGGGPVVVSNNICVGSIRGGIVAQDYKGRNLMDHVWVVHNTLLGNIQRGILLESWHADRDNVLAFNAIGTLANTAPIEPAQLQGTIVGNVTCSDLSACFIFSDSAPYDLRPAHDGPLVNAASNGLETWRSGSDFMGVLRNDLVDVGALEYVAGSAPIQLGNGQSRPERLLPTQDPALASKDAGVVDASSTQESPPAMRDAYRDAYIGQETGAPSDDPSSQLATHGMAGTCSLGKGDVDGGLDVMLLFLGLFILTKRHKILIQFLRRGSFLNLLLRNMLR